MYLSVINFVCMYLCIIVWLGQGIPKGVVEAVGVGLTIHADNGGKGSKEQKKRNEGMYVCMYYNICVCMCMYVKYVCMYVCVHAYYMYVYIY